MKAIDPRTGLRLLDAVSPRMAANVVERLWFTPPHGGVASTLPEGFESIVIQHDRHRLEGFARGDGELAILVHGWGGSAYQMLPLAGVLAESGFRVVAIDLPGHGSDRRRRSDIFQMAAGLRTLVESTGAPRFVVAHSLGALISALAFDQPRPPTAFVAPVLGVGTALAGFGKILDLRPSALAVLARRIEDFCGDDWESLDAGSSLVWGNDLLIVHDREDRSTPITVSRELASASDEVRLVETRGFGHARILAEPEVGAEIGVFLSSRMRTPA